MSNWAKFAFVSHNCCSANSSLHPVTQGELYHIFCTGSVWLLESFGKLSKLEIPFSRTWKALERREKENGKKKERNIYNKY